jgi:hypothetical protein
MLTYPHPFYEVTTTQDYTVLLFHLADTARGEDAARRIAIVWDEDLDARIVQVAVALYFRNPSDFPYLLALSEHQGKITAWLDSATPDPEKVRRALQGAAAVATRQDWQVNATPLLRCRDGAADPSAIPTDHPLYKVSRRCAFGRVRP